ncbi:MAG TPA: MBL fold metallo-hydrolase, partial [Solirubrobacteraceae bacterium]|nr:MBL fold metallo-hydrolase [Solirubrobacteraceae bacterium]
MTVPGSASIPLPGGQPGANVGVKLLRCGESLAPPGWFYRDQAGSFLGAIGVRVPRGQWLRTPIGAFLLDHPGVGPFLVDTGLHPGAADSIVRDFGRVNAQAFRTLRMAPEDAVAAQLSRDGLDPDEIGLVVMTHLHVDHTSGMSQFPGAQFVCSQAEWEAATARRAVLNGYVGRHLPAAERVRTIDFDGPDARSHGPFD